LPIIRVSNELSRIISAKSNNIRLHHQNDIDEFLQLDNYFQNILEKIKNILEKNNYLIVKNIGFVKEKGILESFVKQFGIFYGTIEYTDIKLDCSYTGCNYRAIELHNDDAIDLKNQPKYGFIQVQKEDPLKMAKNGIVEIDDIVRYLEMYDIDFLKTLTTVNIPMLSYGVNYDSDNNEEIIAKQPILYKNNDVNMARFDLTRTQHFYWKKKISQPLEERLIIDKFLKISKKFRIETYLESGDILIYKNKQTLHDRTQVSLEINADNSLNTREIFVSFAR